MSTTPLNPRDALRPLDQSLMNDLIEATADAGPYVSLYMPTVRKSSDTRQNPIRFKALVQQARQAVGKFEGGDATAVEDLLSSLEHLEGDNDFWQHQLDSLAIFYGKDVFHVVRLARPVPEKAAIADSFHVKPLVRILQTAGRYQLLAVSQKNVRLYEGDIDTLDEVPLHPDVPTNVIDALGGEVDGQLNVNSYGGMSHSGMFHGHHDNKDARDNDLERYLRAVDKAVYDYHGRGGDLPLYFAGDVDYHDRFFKASHHPRLVKQGVRVNPDAVEVTPERLRKEMEAIIRPAYEAETAELLEQFGNAKAKQQGSDDLDKVAEAAVQGRILTLLIDADRSIGGRIDPATGKLQRLDEDDPHVDDALDDLAELTMKTGGRVRAIPGDLHPSPEGVAAVFRY